jgi:hypothetical protein
MQVQATFVYLGLWCGRSRITQNHGKNKSNQNMVQNGCNVNLLRKNNIQYLGTLC